MAQGTLQWEEGYNWTGKALGNPNLALMEFICVTALKVFGKLWPHAPGFAMGRWHLGCFLSPRAHEPHGLGAPTPRDAAEPKGAPNIHFSPMLTSLSPLPAPALLPDSPNGLNPGCFSQTAPGAAQ